MIKDFIEIIRLRLHGIKLLDVDNDAIQAFRKHVKNNKFLDDETIIKKINRDWILAKDTEYIEYDSGFEVCIRNYGNLEIGMYPASYYGFKKDKIAYIYNHKGRKIDFKIDKELKEELNKIMRL